MEKTFSSFVFGCRVNQAELEAIDNQLVAAGFSKTNNNPAVFIINSCAVTSKAEREVRQLINQTRKQWPKTKIVVTGCAATHWLNQRKTISQVDYLIDNTNKEFFAKYLIQKLDPSLKNSKPKTFKLKSKYFSSKRLMIKIQDGCHRFCSFCIVPYLRGRPKSKTSKAIVAEIKQKEKEVREVILTAINTEAYGLDTKETFVDLLKTIIKRTKIDRLSFGSIHPQTINRDFIDFYQRVLPRQRLVNFFHIPFQSGSNKILSLMKRGYTKEELEEKVYLIKKINPNAFVATDIIVGFLEETDDDFNQTYQLLKNAPVSKFHLFRFSKREGTAAFFMAKRLKEPAETVKKKRLKLLKDLSFRKYRQFLQKQVGQVDKALLINKRKEGWQQGLLTNQIPVWIKTEKNIAGQIRTVKVDRFKDNQLLGRVF